jgi:8-oxo-dGTP diphosphatase
MAAHNTNEKTYRFEQIDWEAWVPTETATLLFVLKDDKILLIHKKRGLGAGKINGPGGRLEPNETPEAAAIREVEEELCVTPTGVEHRGELFFQFTNGHAIHGHVFIASDCDGEPRETHEAIPCWTPLDKIPYDRMWADDRLWLPLLLEGQRFLGRFLFEEDAMLGHSVETVG